MKNILLALTLGMALPAWGDNLTSGRLVEAGADKAVVFEETVSPDGLYAIGWTILRHKNVPPVDWSLWNPDDSAKLIDTYFKDSPAESTQLDIYELVNCVIDLKGKRLLILPSDNPDYPNKNRGFLVASWGPGDRYALVQNNGRFSTDNLWLISTDPNGMRQTDLANPLEIAVAAVLQQKRQRFSEYATLFSLSPVSGSTQPAVSFTDSTVTFPFESDLPKSGIDGSEVDGTIELKLPEGTVLKVSSDTPSDDPFQNDSELAKANALLNKVYSELQHSLPVTKRAALKKEQLGWIRKRDAAAAQALSNNSDQPDPKAQAARDEALLNATQARTAELNGQLAGNAK